MQAREVLVSRLSQIYLDLVANHATATEPVVVQRDFVTVIGVRAGLQSSLDFKSLRSVVSSVLGTGSHTNLVQVVGNSGTPFNEQSCEDALSVLSKHIDSNSIVEYGYTCKPCDANWVTAEFVKTNNSVHRAIANLVGQSIDALRAGWEGLSEIRDFIMIYDEAKSVTSFGGDVWVSDGLMFSGFDDKLICLNGGVQSFTQAVNVLQRTIRVVAVELASNDESLFSAASLLRNLADPRVRSALEAKNVLQNYCNSTRLQPESYQKLVIQVEKLFQTADLSEWKDLISYG